MNAQFRESFVKDLRKIRDRSMLARVQAAIETVEAASELTHVAGLKKLRGASDCYRIRIGDYRIGIAVKEQDVVFVRVLNRKDLYRYFP